MGNNAKSKRKGALYSEGVRGRSSNPSRTLQHTKDLCCFSQGGGALPGDRDNPDDAYKYTAKATVAVMNSTAVLRPGDIGAMAGKRSWKARLLFKTFADVDVFDIESRPSLKAEFIETVKNISGHVLAGSTWKTSRRPNVSRSKNA